MGVRRLSSTSPTRRRFRSDSPVCVTEEYESVYGVSSLIIWLITSSSLICVLSPTGFDLFFEYKMYRNMGYGSNQYDPYQYEEQVKSEQIPPFFNRPMGLRWRDDANLMMNNFDTVQVMPILTQHRSGSPFGRSASSSRPTTSNRYDYDSPSLEDIDLIDVLWRDDIAREKGACQVALAEQFERDLQMLTEKSNFQPLTAEEHARFEDLSKGFYDGFYSSFRKSDGFGAKARVEEEYNIPTDEDLAELLDDVSKEEGQLNSLFEKNSPSLLRNVSMSDAVVYSQNNLTEMRQMREEREQIGASSSSSSGELPSSIYHQPSDVNSTQQWMRSADLGPADVFPETNYGFIPIQNETEVAVSNGNVEYDHAYQSKKPENLTPVFDLYHSTRQSFSDCTTDSSSTCSRLSSESPRYNSESSSSEYSVSRFYGKLVPNERGYSSSRASSPRSKIGRVVPIGGLGDKRKRGRQSKDEQLASENGLPVSARQIAEMTLSELQLVLKNERLTEAQKELIRKIRRRGKNKVAARTCRQRRTDRHEKALSMPQ